MMNVAARMIEYLGAIFDIWVLSRENLSPGFPTKRVSNQSSATETSKKIKISAVASLHMILSKKRIT